MSGRFTAILLLLIQLSIGIARAEETRRGLLGFDWHAQMEDGTAGFRVRKIVPDSPAAKAGLQVQDFLIAVDGKPYRFPIGWESKMIRPLGSPPVVGQKVTFTVRRGGENRTVELIAVADPRAEDVAKFEQEADARYAPKRGLVIVVTELIDRRQRITLRRRPDNTLQIVTSPLAPGDVAEAEKVFNGEMADLFRGLGSGVDHVIEFDERLTPVPYRRISPPPGG